MKGFWKMDKEIEKKFDKTTAEEILKDLKHEEFIAEKGQETWQGHSMQAESAPLIDPGVGEPRIIRTFTFKFNPEFIKNNKGLKGLNKQELFNNHWKMLQVELWKDGLVPDEGIEPSIIFKKDWYIIQITCKARMGVIVADTPQTLNTYLAPKKKR